jgi:hypothetical protein
MARPLATLRARISRSVTRFARYALPAPQLVAPSEFPLTSMKVKLVPKCLRLQQPEVERQVGIDEEGRRDRKKTRDSVRSQNCRGVTGTRPPIVTNHLRNADFKFIGQIEKVLAKSSRLSGSCTRLVYLSRAKSTEKRPDQAQPTVADPVNDLVEARWIIRKTVQQEYRATAGWAVLENRR